MQTLLELLARNAAAATLLAGIVLALSLVIRRPAVRNALWLIVLVRLLMPPIWSVPVWTTEAPAVAKTPDLPPAPLVLPRADSAPFTNVSEFSEPEALARANPALASASGSDPMPQQLSPRAEVNSWNLESFVPWLFAIWMSGVLLIGSLAIRRVRRFQHGLRDAIQAPEEIQFQASELAQRMGLKQAPCVWLVPGRVPPMLWMPGLRIANARLILPLELFFQLDAEQRGALIAHELAHLKRHDPWVRWLELLVVALYWWHPLLGFIRSRLRSSEEECCDAYVVARLAERKAYATALMETVDFLDGPDSPASPVLASRAGPVHDLQWRLTMIMRGSIRGRLSRFGALALLGVAVAALAFGPSFTNAQPEEKKERPFGQKGERFKGNPGDKDRPMPPRGEGPANEELEKARQELQRARENAEKAMQRVKEIEEQLKNVRGPDRPPIGERKFNPDGPKGPPRGDGNRPDDRGPQDLQKQIEDRRRQIENLRRQIEQNGGPDDGPKGPPMGDRKGPPMGDGQKGRPMGDGPKGPPMGDGQKGPPMGDGQKGPPMGEGKKAFPFGRPFGDGQKGPPFGRFRPNPDGGPEKLPPPKVKDD
ncbi:MAG: hypothetical protein K8T89_24850 [Planctomycetes bacterium]|nr:hypothetical protein [Planctomycetota bacterium]